jgi:serine/threonine protein kinase
MGGIIHKQVTTNDFIFYQKLGKGEFGEVILIKNRSNFHYFAVKEINLMKVFENGVKPIMLSNELNALKRLQSHPFITELMYSFIESNYCYMVLEYLNGGTLRDLLFMKYVFTERQIAFLIGCIASGLAYIHRHGIIHRDIKPENIVLDCKGLPHIADFGISYVEPFYSNPSAAATHTSNIPPPAPFVCRMTSGTEQYCAPECLAAPHEHGIEVDYWSLGIMTYELMFQMRPYKSRVPKNCVRYVEGLRKPKDTSDEIFGSGFQSKGPSQAEAQQAAPSLSSFSFNLRNFWSGNSPAEKKIKPAREISHRSVTWKFDNEHSVSFSLAAIFNRTNRIAIGPGSTRVANPSQRVVVVEARETRPPSNPPLSVYSATQSGNQGGCNTQLQNQVSFGHPVEELVCPSCSDSIPLSLMVPFPPAQYYLHVKREKPSPAFFSLLGMLLDVRASHRIGHEATGCLPAILDHDWFAGQDLPISTLKSMCFENPSSPPNFNNLPGLPLNSSSLPTHLIHDHRPPKSVIHKLFPNKKLSKLRKEIGDFTFVSSRFSDSKATPS